MMKTQKRINGIVVDVEASPEDVAQRDADIAAAAEYASPAARTARLSAALADLMTGPDPEMNLLARIVFELAKDMANEKGRSPVQYRADLLARIK